jgi:predicted porin
MKKTIIAASIAAVVAAPAAMAEVSVSGLVHMSITDTNTGSGSTTSVADNVSRLVFSGKEDLGNGMSAGFKLEQRLEVDESLFKEDGGRESYAYLAGDFGSVKLGRMYGPTKRVFSMAGQAGDTAIDITSMTGAVEVTNDNAVYYTSPNMSGLTLTASISNAELADESATNDVGEAQDISLTYSANGLSVGVGSYSDDQDGANDHTAVAVKYAMGDFTVAVSQMDRDATVSTETEKATAVTASMKMGSNKIIAQFGEKETVAGTETDGWGLALVHSMSKQTSVYAGLRDSDVTSDTDTAVALGMKHTF